MRSGIKPIYGVGINDADYKVNTTTPNGESVRCEYYTQWKNMMARSYGKSTHKRQPTYIGCSVDPKWHSFMAFKAWMEVQDWEGKALDKDILVEGNKVYGPDTCVFVTQEVNMFLSPNGKERDLPRGVYANGMGYKTQYTTKETGQVYLGQFDTPEEAREVYTKYKSKLAIELAARQPDKRVADALIKRFVIL